MSQPHDPLTDPLNAWLESGLPRESGNGADPDLASLQAAARQFHDLARRGERFAAADSPLPFRWEDVMAANTISAWTKTRPSTRFGRAAVLSKAEPSRRISPPVSRDRLPEQTSRLAHAVLRWQPAISLAVVVAFLVGLVGIAWQRGVLDENGGFPPGSRYGMQAIPQSTPNFDVACAPHPGTRPTDDELQQMSYGDWQVPAYGVALAGWTDHGVRALNTYQAFMACYFEDLETPEPGLSDATMSYLSDRLRYVMLYDTLSVDRQAEIDLALGQNPVPGMIDQFPIPVNRGDQIMLSPFPGESEAGSTWTVLFTDVYLLPDHRLAAMMGSVSTHMLRTGEPIRNGDGMLVFIAFSSDDDIFADDFDLYVDELFVICPSAFAPGALDDGGAIATQPHNPAQLVDGSSATCAPAG
jgi:hypothetical protein